METVPQLQIIARIHSDFTDKFGIPRQSGLVPETEATVVFEPDYRNPEALRGLEEYSHIWLIWLFSRAVRETWSPTVRPPRLGGNRRMGVFATRSPFRPNALGLSSVQLLGAESTAEHGTVLRVAGADLLDGTPILDIKPYIPYADAHPDAAGGWTDHCEERGVEVICSPDKLERVIPAKREALLSVLRQDPRPAYQHDAERVYAMDFGGYTVRFRADTHTLTVLEIEPK